ncbi:hypothetical protein [Advenella sp. FME57]|uniref:hypothetical protein n=1 Tax=Advenella sp. FME57 TaxID=2742604 RepID=UPI0018696BD6|nr:hypothetical protein [Advenella sp. FME57]
MESHTSLGEEILAAFMRACDERNLRVAERALEAMTDPDEGEEQLICAYLQVACSQENSLKTDDFEKLT